MKISKLEAEHGYVMTKIDGLTLNNLNDSLEDENGRTLTLKKVNKRISELKYNLNPENNKVRGTTFRHPLLKKIAEVEERIKDNKRRLDEINEQSMKKQKKTNVVIDIEQPPQASSSTNKNEENREKSEEGSEYHSENEDSDNRLSDLEIDGNNSE